MYDPAYDMELRKRIFNVTAANFNALALEISRFQYAHNETYRQYCDLIKCDMGAIGTIMQIPFLPIGFFKSREIKTTVFEPVQVFESSGTTGAVNSKHLLKDIALYEESFLSTFGQFYGDISGYCILGLLPSYLERSNSSLVSMTNELIKRSGNAKSGFYLYDLEQLHQTLLANETEGLPTLLIGVTYALLDFANAFPMQLRHTIVMETGGMKGRKKELTRSEVHAQLQQQWGINEVHAEYGMTELLSQAYAKKTGLFGTPPWMQVLLRAEDDPFHVRAAATLTTPLTGAGNIIDLANLYSCSFIATDDMIRLYPPGEFEVLGRLDNSDVRGCGLMVMS
jgi:hypothetical protein